MATRDDPFRVVFVCTGNICRSPMAEVVFRWFADQSLVTLTVGLPALIAVVAAAVAYPGIRRVVP